MNRTEAKEIKTNDKDARESVKRVNFFIFFDGTNNNMVQQAYYHTYKTDKNKNSLNKNNPTSNNKYKSDIEFRDKLSELKNLKEEAKNKYNKFYEISSSIYAKNGQDFDKINVNSPIEESWIQQKQSFIDCIKKIIDKNKEYHEIYVHDENSELDEYFLDNENKIIAAIDELEKGKCPSYLGALNAYDNSLKTIQNMEERLQAMDTEISLEAMASDEINAYSNIAILHSLADLKSLNEDNGSSEETLNCKLYVEGSGAKDIAHSEGTGLLEEGDINGLGFGLGDTGVTALVSKAIKFVYEFLASNRAKLDENTEYKFYLFGFSRGSTCARIFAHLAAREISEENLKREKEFGQDSSKIKNLYKKYKRVTFMENDNFIEKLTIPREKVTVEFLGIYDTVSSIGFLKQKDGWSNILSLAYRMNIFNNYHGNFHYMNTYDYGLYSPYHKRVKKICHICACDEFRENFALVSIGKCGENGNLPEGGSEYFIPGCHSDIGGGYVEGTGLDYILYKFKPRKSERLLKFLNLGSPLLFFKDKAQLIVGNPFSRDIKQKTQFGKSLREDLCPDSLAKLGWVSRNWSDTKKWNEYKEITKEGKPYTLRVANWPNEVKFMRYSEQGYSNIPLGMMIKKYILSTQNDDYIVKNLFGKCSSPLSFESSTVDSFTGNNYSIPKDLKVLGDAFIKNVSEEDDKKRIWLCPRYGYSGEVYRKLRLRFLHFSSSCEIMHMRTTIDSENMHGVKEEKFENDTATVENVEKEGFLGAQFDFDGENFGNNPNYDNDSLICRIVYQGSNDKYVDHKTDVHYTYDLAIDKRIEVSGDIKVECKRAKE